MGQFSLEGLKAVYQGLKERASEPLWIREEPPHYTANTYRDGRHIVFVNWNGHVVTVYLFADTRFRKWSYGDFSKILDKELRSQHATCSIGGGPVVMEYW